MPKKGKKKGGKGKKGYAKVCFFVNKQLFFPNVCDYHNFLEKKEKCSFKDERANLGNFDINNNNIQKLYCMLSTLPSGIQFGVGHRT